MFNSYLNCSRFFASHTKLNSLTSKNLLHLLVTIRKLCSEAKPHFNWYRVPGTQKILLRQQETYNYRDDARCVIGSTWWLPKCFLMFVHKMKLIPTRKHVYGADDKTNEWHWSIPFPPWQLQLWQMSLWMCNSKLMKWKDDIQLHNQESKEQLHQDMLPTQTNHTKLHLEKSQQPEPWLGSNL
jgi:hypothetical protein